MIKIVTLALFALCSFSLLFSQRSSAAETTAVLPKKNQVLDMHCHVAGIGAGGSGAFLSQKLQSSWKYRIYLQAFGVTEKRSSNRATA